MSDKKQFFGPLLPAPPSLAPVLLKLTVGLPHGWVEPNCRQGGLVQNLPDEAVPAFADPAFL